MDVSDADIHSLGSIALFSGIDEPTLRLLAARMPVQELAEGSVVFREGEQGRAMYVVLSGGVEVHKQSAAGNDVRLWAFSPGEWFGENSLVDIMARPTTARASTPTRLLVVKPTDLDVVYRSDPKMYALLVMNIARQLSRKLRKIEAALADAR